MFTKLLFFLKVISFLHPYIFPNILNNVTMQRKAIAKPFSVLTQNY